MAHAAVDVEVATGRRTNGRGYRQDAVSYAYRSGRIAFGLRLCVLPVALDDGPCGTWLDPVKSSKKSTLEVAVAVKFADTLLLLIVTAWLVGLKVAAWLLGVTV